MQRQARPAQPTYPAVRARQGEIMLRTPWERGIFIAALVAAFALTLAVVVFYR